MPVRALAFCRRNSLEIQPQSDETPEPLAMDCEDSLVDGLVGVECSKLYLQQRLEALVEALHGC